MSTTGSFLTGALIGIAILLALGAATDAIATRHKRRRERIAAEQEWKARLEAEAEVKQIADTFRANVIAADAATRAAFDEQRRACACGECKAWRQWAAGRNN